MSRVAIASIGFAAALLNFLPLPVQGNDGPIPVYAGHPQAAQKPTYASRAEWPLFSAQTHWCEHSPLMPGCQAAPTSPAHGHVDCKVPLFGVIRRAPLTIDCVARMYHLPGQLNNLVHYGEANTLMDLFSGPLPYVGSLTGLVEKPFRVTYRAEDMPMTNGLQHFNVTGVYDLTTGSGFYTMSDFTLYVVADPVIAVPMGLTGHDFITTSHVPAGRSSAGLPGNQGNPTVDFPGWLPIAPITAPFDIVARGLSYQIEENGATFPGSGFMEFRLDPNLHMDIPGALIQRVDVPATQLGQHTAMSLRLDPAVLGPGAHKILTRWKHTTGPGNARFAAGEEFEALATFDVVVGTGGPGPTPVDCAGTKAWIEVTPGAWHQVFTVTQQPSNGGKSCAVVANGG